MPFPLPLALLPATAATIVSWRPTVTTLPPDPTILTPHKLTKVNYGPYYAYDKERRVSTEANTYYVFAPAGDAPAAASRPVVVEFHGGGFTGGKATSSTTAQIDNMLSNGVAFVSMDYRLVATKYYYRDAAGAEREEQFIHAGEDGRLTLDGEAAPASSYAVRVGRQEFNTKCSFDAAASLDDLLGRAGAFGLDVHRVGLTGGSAGGGEIHYLSWVYPYLDDNWQRYTVRTPGRTGAGRRP